MKLGVNQANTVVHIHRTGKTDDGISTCALFPAVTISFGIQLSLSLFLSLSLSLGFFVFFFSLSLSLSLSLSVCRFCGKFPYNNVMCWRGYLAITLATT